MSRILFRDVLFGAGLAAASCIAPAYAQDEIVVVARRVEERLQDVPISITVLNQDQLSNANVVNATDLASVTPSLSTNPQFGSENSNFAIRGFVQDIGTQPSVGVYFNDVVAPRGFSNGLIAGDGAGPGSFFDLQNVQVLRGPQGTLFGRNTTGGAILLVPQQPTDVFEGYITASAGNYDMHRLQGVVNIPLGDQAAVRFGIDDQRRDGYLENTSGIGPDDFNGVNYTAYRGSLRVDFTPTLTNTVMATYTDSDTHGSSQRLVRAVAGGGLFPRFNALGALGEAQLAAQGSDFYEFQQDLANPESVLRTWQLINTTTWDINNNLRFRNIVSYGELTNDQVSPIFGTNLETAGGDPISFSITSPVNHTASQGTFTEEARFEGSNFDDRLTWQGGAYFEYSMPQGVAGSFSPVLANCGNIATLSADDVLTRNAAFDAVMNACSAPLGDGQGVVNVTTGETTAQTTGVYLQGTYDVNEQLALTLGYRYTWDRIKNEANQFTHFLSSTGGLFDPPADFGGFIGTPPGTDFGPSICSNPQASLADNCSAVYSVSTEAPTWLVGLDYTPFEDLLLYAKYARGYRSGTISPNVVPPFTSSAAEQVDTYEIGSKWSFEAGGMPGILNVSLFFNDFESQQLQVGFVRFDIPAAPTAAPLNVGASEIYGAEIQFSIQPIDGLTLALDYAYLQTEIIESPAAVDGNGDGIPDPFVPDPVFGPYLVVGSIFPGDPLVLSPENKFTLSAQYELPLDENIGRVTLGAQLIHTDEQITAAGNATLTGFEDLANLEETDIVNLNIGWEQMFGSSFDLNVFGTNVTEEEYFTYIPGIAQVTGIQTASVGAPSMYGVSLTYRFGANAN